ncbi:hypothetical protein FOC4_g10000067 [Fusarium odoratissimum]|uniref:HAT C-terminal dimerisation domain-containing protein n=1 Tax=Fusarium oxysporum f. sp. cubense (strain race 4) TaxID=2502994 RepID=N1RV31_FUSC4|nr:hypothetical protein FOC4_g10000067 [Fusarium odoratissimum]
MSSLMTSTSTDPAGIPVSTSELCSSSIFSTNPRFSSGDVHAAKQLAKREETLRHVINHKAAKLQSTPWKLHLSADVWSAPNHKAFLGICVKFVDPDTKEALQALLALSELPGLDGPGSHGGAEQWKLLQHVLEDYNIWNKVGFYTGDNHGSNDYRWNEFKKRAGRSLGLDNDTRWNSWFLLLDTTLNLQSYVEWYQKKYYQDLRDDYLTPDEWSALGETRAFLQPFWKITQLTEDESPAYGAAIILHPSRRVAHIKKNWPKSWHKPVLDGVRKHWKDYHHELPLPTTTPQLRDEIRRLDEYDLLARELDVVSPSMSELDEYDAFTTQPPIIIDCSPLSWWLREEQQQTYPRLSRMAVDILSIPAMSAEPERVFSGARRTISWDRCQLGSRTIERGECMKSWIKSGITQGYPVDLLEAEGIEDNNVEGLDDSAGWQSSNPDSV